MSDCATGIRKIDIFIQLLIHRAAVYLDADSTAWGAGFLLKAGSGVLFFSSSLSVCIPAVSLWSEMYACYYSCRCNVGCEEFYDRFSPLDST